MAEPSQGRAKRRKWTEQMNTDVLRCKKDAVAMTTSDCPPLDDNGKKKGYIKLMKELWDIKGYKDLNFSSQNLRDQAARIEKTLVQTSKDVYSTTISSDRINADTIQVEIIENSDGGSE